MAKTWRCDTEDSAPGRFQHLIGAIQLLKLRCTKLAATKSRHHLDILMAESILFHASTMKSSSPLGAAVEIDDELWMWMESVLQLPLYDNMPSLGNHPVLGTPWKLNKLVFEVSRLSTRTPLRAQDILEKERIGDELTR